MVHRFRQAQEDPPAFLTESEAEVRKKIQDVKILSAEEADLEVKMQQILAKKRKIIKDRI
jgi:Tfp pilus assembly protein PilN